MSLFAVLVLKTGSWFNHTICFCSFCLALKLRRRQQSNATSRMKNRGPVSSSISLGNETRLSIRISASCRLQSRHHHRFEGGHELRERVAGSAALIWLPMSPLCPVILRQKHDPPPVPCCSIARWCVSTCCHTVV